MLSHKLTLVECNGGTVDMTLELLQCYNRQDGPLKDVFLYVEQSQTNSSSSILQITMLFISFSTFSRVLFLIFPPFLL